MAVFVCLTDKGFYFSRKECDRIPAYLEYSDEAGIDEFFENLVPGTIVELLIDVVEEEIEIIDVPKIFPWERKNFLQLTEKKIRNKRILFIRSDFIKDKFSKEHLRVVKIGANQGISAFVARLEKRKALVQSIYISDLVFEDIIFKINFPEKEMRNKIKKEKFIIVVRRDDTTFKQIYFDEGKASLIRTIEIPDDVMDPVNVYDYVIRECDMTIKYLYSSKLVQYGQNINMVFMDSDEWCSHKDSLKALVQSSLIALNEWEDDAVVEFYCYSDLIGKRAQSGISIDSSIFFLLCWLSSSMITRPHLVTEAVSLVRTAVLTKKVLIMLSFALLLVGGYYLGSMASRYMFLTDSIDYINNQIIKFSKMKKALIEKIKIPYDARDLKALVEFSQSFPKSKNRSDFRKPILDLSNLLNKHKDIKLVRVDIERAEDSEIVSREIGFEAQFVLTRADVLYQKNLDRINKFIDDLRAVKGFGDVQVIKLPIEVEPNRNQVINQNMLMPISLPFKVKWIWSSNE